MDIKDDQNRFVNTSFFIIFMFCLFVPRWYRNPSPGRKEGVRKHTDSVDHLLTALPPQDPDPPNDGGA